MTTERTAEEAARCSANTDREIYREPDTKGIGAYYSGSVHVTEAGAIGINFGGHVIVKPISQWVGDDYALTEARAEIERLNNGIAQMRAQAGDHIECQEAFQRGVESMAPRLSSMQAALRQLASSTEALLRFSNPCSLPEDHSKQYLAAMDQCMFARAALSQKDGGKE